jgi:hypothetical protein
MILSAWQNSVRGRRARAGEWKAGPVSQRWTAREMASAVRSGARTATEFTEHALAGVEVLDPVLHFIDSLAADLALAAARRIDASPRDERGALAGCRSWLRRGLRWRVRWSGDWPQPARYYSARLPGRIRRRFARHGAGTGGITRAIPRTPAGRPAARQRARRPRWQQAWCRWPQGPIRPARCGSQPRYAGSPASRAVTGGYRARLADHARS